MLFAAGVEDMMGSSHAMSGAAAWLALTATTVPAVGLFPASPGYVVLGALKAMRVDPESGFSLASGFAPIFNPGSFADWVQLGGILVLGLISGLFGTALATARKTRAAG